MAGTLVASLRRASKRFSAALLSGQLLMRRWVASLLPPSARVFAPSRVSSEAAKSSREAANSAGEVRLALLALRPCSAVFLVLDKTLRLLGRALPALGFALLLATAAAYFWGVRPTFHSLSLPETPLLAPPLSAPLSTRALPLEAQQEVWKAVQRALTESDEAALPSEGRSSGFSQAAAVLPACTAFFLLFFVGLLYCKCVFVAPGFPPKAGKGALSEHRLADFRRFIERFCGVVVSVSARCRTLSDETRESSPLPASKCLSAAPSLSTLAEAPAAEDFVCSSKSVSTEEEAAEKSEAERLTSGDDWRSGNSDARPFSTQRLGDSSAGAELRVCEKCRRLKTPRTRHCSACAVCVVRHDHHCPWLNQCIGVRNARYFLSLLFFLVLLCAFGVWAFAGPAAVLMNLPQVALLVKARETRVSAVFAATAGAVSRLEGGSAGDFFLTAEEERRLEAAFFAAEPLETQKFSSPSFFAGLLGRALFRLVLGSPAKPPERPSAEQIFQVATRALQAARSALQAAESLSGEVRERFRRERAKDFADEALEAQEGRRELAAACALRAAFEFSHAAAQRLAGPPPFDARCVAFAERALKQRGFLLPLAVIGTAVVATNLGIGVFALFLLHLFLTVSNHTTLSLLVSSPLASEQQARPQQGRLRERRVRETGKPERILLFADAFSRKQPVLPDDGTEPSFSPEKGGPWLPVRSRNHPHLGGVRSLRVSLYSTLQLLSVQQGLAQEPPASHGKKAVAGAPHALEKTAPGTAFRLAAGSAPFERETNFKRGGQEALCQLCAFCKGLLGGDSLAKSRV